jgi:hypothetical protein
VESPQPQDQKIHLGKSKTRLDWRFPYEQVIRLAKMYDHGLGRGSKKVFALPESEGDALIGRSTKTRPIMTRVGTASTAILLSTRQM